MGISEQEEFEFRARAEAEQAAQAAQAQGNGGMLDKIKGTVNPMFGSLKNYAQQVGQLDASKWYRPALEMGGAAGAGLAAGGSTLGTASFAGGALGFAGGKAAADAIDRFRGIQKPFSGPGEAVKEAGGDVLNGVEAEMGGRATAGAVGAAAKPLAKGFGALGRLASGVRQNIGERLFNNPEGLFMGTGKYGKILGDIRNQLGIIIQHSNKEIVDTEGAVARRTALETLNKLDRVLAMEPGEEISATELIKGKAAMDKLIEKTPLYQRNQRRIMMEATNKLSDHIMELAGPAERAAAKDYSKAAAGAAFRKILPVTKWGDYSLARPMLTAATHDPLKAAGGMLLQAPALSGAVIAGSGAAYKGANAAMQNPATRRMLWSQIVDALNHERGSNP